MDQDAPAETDTMAAVEAAASQHDHERALALLAAFRRAHPADPDGYVKACDILRKQRRLEEAAALAEQGLRAARGGKLPLLLIQKARIQQATGDFDGALTSWRTARTQRPNQPGAYVGETLCLHEMGQLDAAEYLATYAAARFPQHAAVLRQTAAVAAARHDWPAALERWDRVLALNPQDAVALRERAAATESLARGAGGHAEDDDEPDHDHVIVDVGRQDDPAIRDLVMRFESLGQNCELGLLQRHFGAEPLGLLRWANTRPPLLLSSLKSRFEGLAQTENLTLTRSSSGENVLTDTLFNQPFHTFQRDEITDEPTYLAKHAARLRFLRDKLLSELDAGEKIFIYKPNTAVPPHVMAEIVAAARDFPKLRLLWIDLADAQNPPGSVLDCGDRLMRGFLSVFNPVRPGVWEIPFTEWVTMLRRAAAIVDG